MRILQVFGGFRAFKIASWLAEHDIETHQIILEAPENFTQHSNAAPVKFHNLKYVTKLNKWLMGKKLAGMRLHLLLYPLYLGLIANTAKQNKVDIIHAHRHTGAFMALIAKKIFGLKAKLVFDYQDPWVGEERAKTSFLFRIIAKLFHSFESLIIRKSDFVLTQGREQTNILVSRHHSNSKKFDFTWNTVDESRFKPGIKSKLALRREYGLENSVAILYSGSIVHYYGIHLIPEALKEVVREFPEAKFVVSGIVRDVDYWNSIKKKIKDYGLEKNFVELKIENINDIPARIAMCNIGLVTHTKGSYISEVAIPTKLFEYMACGLAIVTSDMDHLSQFVVPEKCGVSFRPNDSKSLASALTLLLRNPAKMTSMGSAARRAVEKKFNWGIEMKKVLKDYQGLLERNAA